MTAPAPTPPRALVLGGYGLIGAAAMRALMAAGFEVTGVGRSETAARRVLPQARWHFADVTTLSTTDWQALCADVDVVVNAAGALQDGGGTDLAAIHTTLPARLSAALVGSDTRLIQISAAGVSEEASTAFFRTKARGDAAIVAAGIDHVILRPTLVIGAAAYGGTALLRAVAALPLIDWRILEDTPVQTIALSDLTAAIVTAAKGDIAAGTIADLTEAEARPFPELIRDLRHWLGLPAPGLSLPLPGFMLSLVGKGADLLGLFGWRSPLRSTALTALSDGITGDPTHWLAAGGRPCRALTETLADLPATVQERWFSRLFLLFPLVIATLSLFWLASGLIGLAQFPAAVEVLTSRGSSAGLAAVAVAAGIFLDLALGLMVLWRRGLRPACLGMIAVTLGYLGAGTLVAPDLWADPLGPFVKTLPAAVLALIPLALEDTR